MPGRGGPEESSETFEGVAAEDDLFTKGRAYEHGVKNLRKRGRISHQVMKGQIDRRRAKQRHDERFHKELQADAKNKADYDRAHPTARPGEPDGAPGCARTPNPNECQNRTQRSDDVVAGEDYNDGQKPDRAESAEARAAVV